jgi:hypothetical protein
MSEPLIEKEIHIRAIFKESWNNVKGLKLGYGNKFKVWVAMFIFIVGGLAATAISIVLAGMAQHKEGLHAAIIFVSSISIFWLCLFALFPLLVGLQMMGVRWVMKQPVLWKHQFAYYRDGWRIAAIYFFMTFLSAIISVLMSHLPEGRVGSAVFSIFHLFVTVPCLYAALLVADHRLKMMEALKVGFRGFFKHLFPLLIVLFLCGVLELLAILPLDLALHFHASHLVKVLGGLCLLSFIWIVPLSLNIFAMTYRDVFGVKSLG